MATLIYGQGFEISGKYTFTFLCGGLTLRYVVSLYMFLYLDLHGTLFVKYLSFGNIVDEGPS